MVSLLNGPHEMNVWLNKEESTVVQQGDESKLVFHARIVNQMSRLERKGIYTIFVYDNNLNLIWQGGVDTNA